MFVQNFSRIHTYFQIYSMYLDNTICLDEGCPNHWDMHHVSKKHDILWALMFQMDSLQTFWH